MQVIKYKWHNWSPRLVLSDHGKHVFAELMDHNINFIVGKNMCLGYFQGGKHHPCKNNREAEDGHCNECKLEDDYFFCIRCSGEQCINKKKRDECQNNFYYIYLAAFDSTLKVGISYEHRIMERLVEQGADFAAKIARIKDGKNVREIEQSIKKDIGITDKITGQQKNNKIFGDPNISVNRLFSAITKIKQNGFSKHLISPEIYDLREFYKLRNVTSQPKETLITEGTYVSGKVVSAKGNLIILKKDNDFFSVNAHRLLGREISEFSCNS